ncbi:MAG TPA: peptide MFS transporter [Burkholderiaceae bacterium]|jgi:POT family proton-dependent oligopeptide transporter|nr:peptide MFS transporter [Burkholderiaceae bacterium]
MVSTALPEPAALSPGKLRHPRALWTMFFSEMWERYSYYGMRALLVLYLVHSAGYSREDALRAYATYTGLVYLSPIVGGYLADRFLGFRKSILIGATVMMFGHAAMAVPALLNVALGLLVTGNGFFKPNMTSLVGAQYGEKDPRRDAGFTYFYMGVNLGAFIAPLLAGWLGERVGWHWGFASAAVGMAFGLIQFAYGEDHFGTTGLPPGREGPARLLRRDWLHVALLSLAAIPFVYAALGLFAAVKSTWALVPWQVNVALPFVGLGWILFSARRSGGREDFERVLAIIVLGVFNVFFWMGFEQAGGTMNLFADSLTDRVVFGWQIPASYFQAVNPVAILALGPVMSAIWTRIDRSPRAPSAPAKMGIGMIILGLGFVLMAVAQQRADRLGQISPLWLTGVYVLHTIGELCLSPIGYSLVTRVSPTRMVGLMMGTWFCFFGAGNYLAGTLENLLAESKVPLYQFLVASSIGPGLALLALVPLLRRWMHGHA